MPRSSPSTMSEPSVAGVPPGEVAEGFERECVEFFADVVAVLGVPRSMGQIYGLLFSSPRPLSFTDITERLDISRGSASQGLQALKSLGAVRSVDSSSPSALSPQLSASPTSRRELFEPEKGLRKLVTGVLREKVDPLVTEGAARLKKLREHAQAAPDEAGRRFSLERVKQIESWRGQLRLLLPLLKTVLGPKRD